MDNPQTSQPSALNGNQSRLEKIRNRFLQHKPVNEIVEAVEALLPDFDDDALVKIVFHNETARKFPPEKNYRLLVVTST